MNYWLKHFNSNVSKLPENLLKQVGKTVNGIEVDQSQITLIVDTICSELNLNEQSRVVDLCCGNGLLTIEVAKHCNLVIGVDYSKNLIKVATHVNSSDNVNYVNSDVTTISPKYLSECDSVYMYEGLQHIDNDGFFKVMGLLSANSNIIKIFIGGIPDRNCISKYYDTEEKMDYYEKCEAKGTPHLGKWWDKSEIETIGNHFGFKMKVIAQNSELYSTYYRFDCLLERV